MAVVAMSTRRCLEAASYKDNSHKSAVWEKGFWMLQRMRKLGGGCVWGEEEKVEEEEYEMRATWTQSSDMVAHVAIPPFMFSEPPSKTALGD